MLCCQGKLLTFFITNLHFQQTIRHPGGVDKASEAFLTRLEYGIRYQVVLMLRRWQAQRWPGEASKRGGSSMGQRWKA